MLMASPMMAPTGVTSKSPELIPTRNSILRAGGSPAFKRAMSDCQTTADFTAEPALLNNATISVAGNLENAPVHLFDAVPDDLQASLKLAGCREVVLLHQAGIAEHIGRQNRVHPAHVASAKLRGRLVAAVEELELEAQPRLRLR